MREGGDDRGIHHGFRSAVAARPVLVAPKMSPFAEAAIVAHLAAVAAVNAVAMKEVKP